VFFNERPFPARKNKPLLTLRNTEDTAEDIIGLIFEDEGETFTITGTSRDKDGELIVDYRDKKRKDFVSTVKEVRQWIAQTRLTQAETMFRQIQTYDTQLPKG
jgi:hypothetical protein